MYISDQLKTFTYLGGKFSMLKFLYEHFPKDDEHFIDVTCGSAVVMLNREQRPIETINDKNRKIVNFFNMLRNCPDELIRQLYLTPHSKVEYEEAWHDKSDSPVEQARKFYVRCVQSMFAAGAQEQSKGWAAAMKESRCNISEKTNKWLKGIEGLEKVVSRLKNIQIECRDFRFILKNYDFSGAFFYFDGPYLPTLRSNSKYEFDFGVQDYLDLHHHAVKLKGRIAISHYDEPAMHEIFGKDFRFIPGPQRLNSNSIKEARECLWVNY